MSRGPRTISLTSLGLALFLMAATSEAQMAAFRDLTLGSRVPSEHLSVAPTCEKPNSSIADLPSSEKDSKALELTIIELSPAKLEIGSDFNASVRLKNVGTEAVLVPSIVDGERALRTSSDRTEEKYEVGDISLRLMTGKAQGIPVYLNSSGALFADPDDKTTYLSLAPGKWLDIKLHARVECGLDNCVSDIQPDNNAVLTAWWYQRILSHRVNGCEETHGSSKIRELDSAPFTVVVKSPTTKAVAVAWK
jgi:hypothetical protein